MSDEIKKLNYPNAHIAWIACLYAITSKIRREGLMSIEGDVEDPDDTRAIFRHFPQTLEQPYLDFATDILRLMVGGNLNAEENTVYAEHYIANLTAKSGVLSGGADESLLRTIWLTLWAAMNGYAPQIAVEFGRQAIPIKLKPRFNEFEQLVKEADRSTRKQQKAWSEGGLDEAAERFVESLQ